MESDRSTKVIKGIIWLLAKSWYSRVLGLASVVVLARCLEKEDFGIIAGCFLVKAFFSMISNFGSSPYLIRKDVITDSELDIAWTINSISKALIAFILFLSAGYISHFLEMSEIESGLRVMAFSSLFIGLRNPALSLQQKQLKYSKIFFVESGSKSCATILTIVIALFYKSYWAVIFGEVVYQAFYAIGTHRINEYRPRYRFNGIKEQLVFSNWLLLKGVVGYAKRSFDKIIIGKFYSLSELGAYNFSREISSIALSIIAPVTSILYPSLSSDLKDKNKLSKNINKFMLIIISIYMPLVIGGVCLSEYLVPIVFGIKWVDIVPLFDLFLIMTFASLLNAMFTDIFTLTGEVKKQFYFECITSAIFILMVTFSIGLPLNEFSQYRVIFAYVVCSMLILVISLIIPVRIFSFIKIMMPALVSVIFMSVVLLKVSANVIVMDTFTGLISAVALGAVSYFVFLYMVIILFKNKFDEYGFFYETLIMISKKVFGGNKAKRRL